MVLGDSKNDFSVSKVSENKNYKYKDWTDQWQNKNTKKMFASINFITFYVNRLYSKNSSCKSSYSYSAPKCNSEKYKNDEFCGLVSSIYSPWSLCLEVKLN